MYKVTIEKTYPVLTFNFKDFEEAGIFIVTALRNSADEITATISEVKEEE